MDGWTVDGVVGIGMHGWWDEGVCGGMDGGVGGWLDGVLRGGMDRGMGGRLMEWWV